MSNLHLGSTYRVPDQVSNTMRHRNDFFFFFILMTTPSMATDPTAGAGGRGCGRQVEAALGEDLWPPFPALCLQGSMDPHLLLWMASGVSLEQTSTRPSVCPRLPAPSSTPSPSSSFEPSLA